MTTINRTYNPSWQAIKFDSYRGCAFMPEKYFAVKSKTEEEYDVVRDMDEW